MGTETGRCMVAPECKDWLDPLGTQGSFVLFDPQGHAELVLDPKDDRGIARACGDLAVDLFRVSGQEFSLSFSLPPPDTRTRGLVLVGTEKGNRHLADLVRRGFLDLSPIRDAWEATLVCLVPAEALGMPVLAIVGSDRRGAIYGLYALAEQLGVSPWHWWSSSPVTKRQEAFILPGPHLIAPPRVKYRGIFLNDEYPNLTRWVAKNYGMVPQAGDPPVPEGVALYGREFYSRIFELLLRLRANYLWPAMWNNAFNEDDPANAALADEYGIVMGTSHQEPMLRAQKEWDRRHGSILGHWDWLKHREELTRFWRQGIRRNKAFESMVTLGLRGADDSEMSSAGPAECRAMVEEIMEIQRTILAEEYQQAPRDIPQLMCLYKEVLDYYHDGLKVPEDVTILWSDDNWGNLRRVPTASERERPGGSGVYYHLDYHGGPRSYQWINTTPLEKILDQMTLASDHGADRVWIVNVGHLKGYELPTEFFLNLAWNPERWKEEGSSRFAELFAEREFGAANAPALVPLLVLPALYNGRRKPELLAPETWSLLNYDESGRVQAAWDELETRAVALGSGLGEVYQESFCQVVSFPIRASALLYRLYRAAGLCRLYARQGRLSASFQESRARTFFQADLDLMNWYNTVFAQGRWCHFMDQPHLGYVSWHDPAENNLDAIEFLPVVQTGKAGGIALEGGEESVLSFDEHGTRVRFFEVFRSGEPSFLCTVKPRQGWIRVDHGDFMVGSDRRVRLSLDWDVLSPGQHQGIIEVSCGQERFEIEVRALKHGPVADRSSFGFLMADGLVSMEARHYQLYRPSISGCWVVRENYGRLGTAMVSRSGTSGFTALGSQGGPALGYQFHQPEASRARLVLLLGPSLNIHPGQALTLGWSLDEAPTRIQEIVAHNYIAQHHNMDWEKVVADNGRSLVIDLGVLESGWHCLWLWMTSPNVIVEKIIIDCGGLRDSYLGPPESIRIDKERLP